LDVTTRIGLTIAMVRITCCAFSDWFRGGTAMGGFHGGLSQMLVLVARHQLEREGEVRAKESGKMKIQSVVGWMVGVMAVAAGLAGCGAATGEDNVSSSGEAVTAPLDPVAFCKASGLNVIIGTQSNDTITGTAAADCIVGLGGQDTINAGGGDDIVFAGEGEDVVNGGDGNDTINAGNGQDNVQGGPGNDTLNGDDGDDQLRGGDGDDTLSGGQGQDRLFGDAGNDKLSGDVGDDQLNGGDGDDALSDCTNHNILNGNAGTNSCQGSTTGNASSTLTNCQTKTACP
jgi:Ca2+-binding RTX toxin-like protein